MLARAGYQVDLFEASDDIMKAASGINQYRMHRGYHYPRSAETITSCRETAGTFEDEYSGAIISHHDHYYGIAKEGSFLSGQEYLAVIAEHDLPYEVGTPSHINPDSVDVVIKAEENLYDPYKIKSLVEVRLREVGVKVHLNQKIESIDELANYNQIVVATYALSNSVFGNKPEFQREYQYEVCEKVVVEIPEGMERVSTVIMDGPFTCFDPLGDTGNAVMGHVVHAIHHTNIGYEPEVPEQIKPYLNQGVIENPVVTNIDKFLESASLYMPKLKNAKHVGSMFTIRTVLPRVDDTDTRPTIVNVVDDRVITIYSGKVGNSVKAANEVLAMINARVN